MTHLVDQNIIHTRIEKIRESTGRLRALAQMQERTFCDDDDACALAERHLQIAIQATIDIGQHIAADMDLGLPTDYRDVFRILAKHKIIPKDLGMRMEAMTGMRNILVHDYLEVDPHRIYNALRNDLADFDEFVAAALKLV